MRLQASLSKVRCLAAGGIMGYRKKGSTASLVSSGSSALLLLLAAGLITNPAQALTGLRIALGEPALPGGTCLKLWSRSALAPGLS